MAKKIIVDANRSDNIRVVLLDNNDQIEDLELYSEDKKEIKGNIYLAKVTRIEPALQAAFVDYGADKNGFLPFAEIHPDYYQRPVEDLNLIQIAGANLNNINSDQESVAEAPSNQQKKLLDTDEIDTKTIEKMIDENIESDINITAAEDEIDAISELNHEVSEKKTYTIQEVVKKGQVILVQATKEARGKKGVSLTTYISLAGKYCVLMPNKPMQSGISKKISNFTKRKTIKQIIHSLISVEENKTFSLIARTAATASTKLEIVRDYNYLTTLWNKIRTTTLESTAPCFIHWEDDIILRMVRDMFTRNVKEIIIQGNDALEKTTKLMKAMLPEHIKCIKEYKSKSPIFTKFKLASQLMNLYHTTVSLPSGGSIVINPTEALIAIDVNSGKSTTERNIEQMALKTNLEAACEVARQCKLRDLSGLIVVDFIDMLQAKHRSIIERSMWEYFSKDKAKIQIAPLSNFGLLEMSRQRLSSSFLEKNTNICFQCSGKGLVRSDEANSSLILRMIENEIYNAKIVAVNIYAAKSPILFLLNNKRPHIDLIEQKYSVKLNFLIDHSFTADQVSIEQIKASNRPKQEVKESPLLQNISEIYENLPITEVDATLDNTSTDLEPRPTSSGPTNSSPSSKNTNLRNQSPASKTDNTKTKESNSRNQNKKNPTAFKPRQSNKPKTSRTRKPIAKK